MLFAGMPLYAVITLFFIDTLRDIRHADYAILPMSSPLGLSPLSLPLYAMFSFIRFAIFVYFRYAMMLATLSSYYASLRLRLCHFAIACCFFSLIFATDILQGHFRDGAARCHLLRHISSSSHAAERCFLRLFYVTPRMTAITFYSLFRLFDYADAIDATAFRFSPPLRRYLLADYLRRYAAITLCCRCCCCCYAMF